MRILFEKYETNEVVEITDIPENILTFQHGQMLIGSINFAKRMLKEDAKKGKQNCSDPEKLVLYIVEVQKHQHSMSFIQLHEIDRHAIMERISHEDTI